jgi:hypothetical protein
MNKPEFFVTPGYGEYMLNNLHYSQAVKISDHGYQRVCDRQF